MRCSLELTSAQVRQRIGWLPRDAKLIFVREPNEHGWVTRWFVLLFWEEGQFITVPVLTQSFITSPSGSNQTTNLGVDATYNNSLNAAEVIGAGAGGACSNSNTKHATGGGGGAWNGLGKSTSLGANFTIASPGVTTFTWRVGAGGIGVVGPNSGNAGGDTWLNDTAFPTTGTNKVGAKGGAIGGQATGSQNGGTGGSSASNFPVAGNSGGRGGNLTGASGVGASGGGGAGGSLAVGGNAGDSISTSAVSTAGGANDQGTGAGTAPGGAGGNGTDWDGNHGSGGGGAGTTTAAATAGAGGQYGGGGAGQSSTSGTSGSGSDGIIVLTWTPVTFDMTMRGAFILP